MLGCGLLAACFGPEGGAGGDAGPRDGGSGPGDFRQTHACRPGDPRDPVDILGVRVEGDTLVVQLGHSGGCAEHEYGLCFDEAWLEEVPVQVPLSVLHDAHGDGCEAYLMTEARFELRPIADEYLARYGGGSGTVRLQLSGGHDYSFEDEALSALEARLDAANHCEALDECVGLHMPPCGTRFVSSQEDTEALQDAIDAWAEQAGLVDLGCPAICRCGLLRCVEGRCEASESDCMDVPDDARMVCL